MYLVWNSDDHSENAPGAAAPVKRQCWMRLSAGDDEGVTITYDREHALVPRGICSSSLEHPMLQGGMDSGAVRQAW